MVIVMVMSTRIKQRHWDYEKKKYLIDVEVNVVFMNLCLFTVCWIQRDVTSLSSLNAVSCSSRGAAAIHVSKPI